MTCAWPTWLAKRTMRSATNSGCSMKYVVSSITPGNTIFPSGSFSSCQIFHSWPWRELADSMVIPVTLALSTISMTSLSAMSRPFVIAPANMDAHLFGWNRLERVIETFDMEFDDFTKLFDAQAGVIRIGAGGQVRAIELQHETGIDDGLVLSVHGVGDCLHIDFFVRVIFVSEKAHKTTG